MARQANTTCIAAHTVVVWHELFNLAFVIVVS